jgi:hypothetical protein
MDTRAQHWLVTIEHLTQPDGKLCASLRDYVAALQKKTPDLVHQRGAITDKLVTDAV